jgi:hypothetical protein
LRHAHSVLWNIIQQELQADCFAGYYAKHAEAMGYLEEGNLSETKSFNSDRNLLFEIYGECGNPANFATNP